MKCCTLSRKTVSEITLLGRPWRSRPSISAGIRVYSKSADISLSVRLFCATRTPSPSENAFLPCSWNGNHFPFNRSYLFPLVRPPWGVKHAGKRTALIVRNLSVTVELSPHLDVRWFQRAHKPLTLPV